MGLFWEVSLTLLSALGLVLLGGLLFGRLLRPAHVGDAWVLLPGRGDGGRLEQALRGMMWLRALGLLRCSTAIVDVDLTPEGRKLALHLAARWDDVVLWPPDHLNELVRIQQKQ